MALVIKNLPASAGDIRDAGSTRGLGRSPGGGHGNPLQYSCLENPMDREAWWVTVYGVVQSRTRLKRLSMNTYTLQRLSNVHISFKQYNTKGCTSNKTSLILKVVKEYYVLYPVQSMSLITILIYLHNGLIDYYLSFRKLQPCFNHLLTFKSTQF